MSASFRVSVRQLVQFAFFAPDIMPAGSVMEAMRTGVAAHQQRQLRYDERWQIERALRHTFERGDESVTVFGRIDACLPGAEIVIEELKHASSIPEVAMPEHRAQAVLYAALALCEKEAERALVRVVYVDETGRELARFEESLGEDEALAQLWALLEPWLCDAVGERAHRELRDESIRSLSFPFPSYRAGQREMARQVYTAIVRRKRLFASLPTGTGKSAAVLFPALKALAQGKTGKVVYLTARTTARQSPLETIRRMCADGLHARVVTLSAKEKLCPSPARCHPADCPRARGHYLRQPDAIACLKAHAEIWDDAVIRDVAQRYTLCPFELALALVGIADVALMDYNYVFDPFVRLSYLFDTHSDQTLLIDEAHHLLERVRDGLSGVLDSGRLARARTALGKALGRKSAPYKALGDMTRALRALEAPDGAEAGVLTELPEGLRARAEAMHLSVMEQFASAHTPAAARGELTELFRLGSAFLYASEHLSDDYSILLSHHGRERSLELYCLSPGESVARLTRRLRGSVFFSATLAPLTAARGLLGGDEEDACFSLPSPFPPENLAVVRKRVNTRYASRERSAPEVARLIARAASLRAGKYIAYFPSYAYLRMVRVHLEVLDTPALIVQDGGMDEAARERFLHAFTHDDAPKLGLCVLGGVFGEGVDLPGEQLIGAIIVGVGLPTPTLRLRVTQAYYDERFGDGFAYACLYPAMQKVLQAGGRVIRGEEDRGLILLLDDRYYQQAYAELLPSEWRVVDERLDEAADTLKGGAEI